VIGIHENAELLPFEVGRPDDVLVITDRAVVDALGRIRNQKIDRDAPGNPQPFAVGAIA
jgi:hypothetical protein